jgi:transcriptional regulator with XRE-family HTH domain
MADYLASHPDSRGVPSGGIDPARIGYIIREMRYRRNLPQKQLADMCAVSVGHISKVENGRSSRSFDTLNNLSAALGVPASMLLVMASNPGDDSTTSQLMEQVQELLHASVETLPTPPQHHDITPVLPQIFADMKYAGMDGVEWMEHVTDEQYQSTTSTKGE